MDGRISRRAICNSQSIYSFCSVTKQQTLHSIISRRFRRSCSLAMAGSHDGSWNHKPLICLPSLCLLFFVCLRAVCFIPQEDTQNWIIFLRCFLVRNVALHECLHSKTTGKTRVAVAAAWNTPAATVVSFSLFFSSRRGFFYFEKGPRLFLDAHIVGMTRV